MEQKLLLSSQLSVHNTLCEVTLNSAALSWRPRGDNTHKRAAGRRYGPLNAAGSQYVPVCEIISVQETEGDCASTGVGKWQKVPQTPVESNQHAFTVSYVERTQKHRWRCSEVTLHCTDRTLCLQWVQAIREQLSLLTIRPKRLLVYINPYGGKHQGKRIYEQKVAPIFSRASISTDVIVTEWANHARDHLKTEAELKKYDGVVCVGGDGMFSEIIHGLISRTQCDSGVDQNLSDETLVPCSLRIGIIPAGSTDCICYATVGSNDPVTSALHIVVGDSQPMDVCSIHHNNTFLRYSVSLLGYGFYGDVLTDSERKRWMGPARYDISGVKTFLSHRYYEGTITFLPADENVGTPRDKLQCRSGCNICSLPSADKQGSKDEESVSDTDTKGVWQVIRGKFLAINAACMSCACPRSPKGLSPSAHLADGTADLILVRRCSRFDFLRHLLRHTNKDDQFDYPFVEVYRVRQFRFTPKYEETDSELDLREADGSGRKRFFSRICRQHPACNCSLVHSSWNCDGEILPHAAIQVRVHCQLIKLFARGIEEHSVFEEPYALSAI
ncbi:ceramide kinase isoform X1 [Tachysurus fulvidraco]|uniref:ceramide kinase isoform X1 n=1 Tax=Tachysurus fulvidraco TaxID=1234273 RepID=UPI001FEDBA69|nr:ceramide kinase isoform X1 [Tachysurus fulvidraco]